MGREFDNEYLKRYLRKLKIKLYISVSENKCSMVEIAQKNLQRRLYSYMVQNETLEYLPFYNTRAQLTTTLSIDLLKQPLRKQKNLKTLKELF